MRVIILILFVFVITNFAKSQDTICLRNGSKIIAIILEKGDVEIKYKKFAQLESAGIYTVFISDISRINYHDGKVDDFTKINQIKESSKDFTTPRMKFNIGLAAYYYKRDDSDNLTEFWRNINKNNKLELSGNPKLYSFNLGMGSEMGGSKRNWFGAGLQLIFSQSDAIYAKNFYFTENEIKLKTFIYCISMYYGHTVNHKKNLILIFEPAIEMGFMSGYANIYNNKYKISSISGIASHFAIGMDWIISKRILASARFGKKFINIKESHESSASKSGYANFYVNPGVSEELVVVKWSGLYGSIGLSMSLYGKIRNARPSE